MVDPPEPVGRDPDRERTGYALDRTVLANERTYAAWIRTGLTSLAAGIAVEKFMADVIPGWGIRAIAMILIAVAAVAFYLAGWRYTHLGVRLGGADVKAVPTAITTAVSVILVLCALLALAGLWIAHPHPG